MCVRVCVCVCSVAGITHMSLFLKVSRSTHTHTHTHTHTMYTHYWDVSTHTYPYHEGVYKTINTQCVCDEADVCESVCVCGCLYCLKTTRQSQTPLADYTNTCIFLKYTHTHSLSSHLLVVRPYALLTYKTPTCVCVISQWGEERGSQVCAVTCIYTEGMAAVISCVCMCARMCVCACLRFTRLSSSSLLSCR